MTEHEHLPDDEQLSLREIDEARKIEQPVAKLYRMARTQQALNEAHAQGVFTRPRQCGCPYKWQDGPDGIPDFTHPLVDHRCGRSDEALPSET